VIRKGLTKTLDADDVPTLIEDDTTSVIWDRFRPMVAPLERNVASKGTPRDPTAYQAPSEGKGSRYFVLMITITNFGGG
jgi:hypothetical protein